MIVAWVNQDIAEATGIADGIGGAGGGGVDIGITCLRPIRIAGFSII